jgi:hypothetical protein
MPGMIHKLSIRSAATDPCRGSVYDADSLADARLCEQAVVINDIQVTSTDHRSYKALVIVSTQSGFLTFNEQSWNRTEVIYGRRAMCAGNITFLAYPDDLTDIFAHLHYQSYQPGVDYIDIRLLYGEGCASFDQKWLRDSFSSASTTTPPCREVARHTIEIRVEASRSLYQAATRFATDFPWSIVFCWVGYPVVYYVIVNLESLCGLDEIDDAETLGAPDDVLPDWIQHRTEDTGDYYYENILDGSITWMAPVGEDFIPYRETGQP